MSAIPEVPNVETVTLPSPRSVPSQPPDIVVLVATKDEYEYIEDLAPKPESVDVKPDTGHCEYRFVHKTEQDGVTVSYRVLLIVMGNQGELLANSILMNTLYNLKEPPLAVVSVGISMSVVKDVRLGDVVFGKTIKRYLERAKIIDVPGKGGKFDITFATETVIELQGVESLNYFPSPNKDRWGPSHDRWRSECSADAQRVMMNVATLEREVQRGRMSKEPRLRFGTVLSGPLLVDSMNFKNKILAEVGRVTQALDMESGGVVLAAVTIVRPKRPKIALVIRGASDLGDGTKGRDDAGGSRVASRSGAPQVPAVPEGAYRRIAMRNAYRSLLMLCDADWFRRPS